MRIGILTLPLHINYGGILQAYALQTVLEHIGYDAVVFQKENKPSFKLPLWKYPFAYGKRVLKKLFVDKRIPIFEEQKDKREFPIIRQHVNSFIKNHVHTLVVDSLYDIDLQSFDAIVVGSDQIWRPRYVKFLWQTNIQDAFLKFTNQWKGRRIAYAVSFGVDNWEYTDEDTVACRQLIETFDAVSVREVQGENLCADNLGIKPILVADPTLLLKAEDYLSLVKTKTAGRKYLFNYILDVTEEKQTLLEQIAVAKDLELRNFRIKSSDKHKSINERIILPVEAWLESLYHAEFVVTDSFHGCVFSIIFGKPFVAIANNRRGASRFQSLFKILGLEDHLIMDAREYNPDKSYNIPSSVVEKLNSFRNFSIDFLRTNLK